MDDRRHRLLGAAVACLGLFAVVAIVVAARPTALARWDADVTRAAAGATRSSTVLDVLFRALSGCGHPTTVDVVCVLAALAALVTHRPRLAVAVVGGRLGSLAIEHVVKALVARQRPDTHPVLAVAGGDSFPSGHTTGTATLAAVAVGWVCCAEPVRRGLRRTAVVLAALLTVGVGASRVFLGVHYVSDVLAGALLGAGSGCLAVWAALRTRLGSRSP